MPFVTTNIISLAVHTELNKRWGMANVTPVMQTKMGSTPTFGASDNTYLSLPIRERMQWVVNTVLPELDTPNPTSHTEQMLQSVGADHLYPPIDKLRIFRMRSVGV
jgi:hypothetical protein